MITKPSFADILRIAPWWRPETLFDVGANVGQTASVMAKTFPDAHIHSFEPVPASYDKLRENMSAVPRVVSWQMAMGAREGVAHMKAVGTKTGNAIVARPGRDSRDFIEVRVTTGDAFCAAESIGHISYLKIDAEGHDLAALVGFGGMIQRQSIDFIEVETSMSTLNRRHVDLQEFRGYLEPHGYHIYRVFEQKHEKATAILRRANAVFVSLGMAQVISDRKASSSPST